MKKRKKTILNILLILFVLSFFVTPLGYESKVFLNRIFAFSPDIIPEQERETIEDYNWQLKDENWNFFNFNKSKGKVIFVNFWVSWKVPSVAELKSIEKLYHDYKDKVDFYIITNEEREPVEELMSKRGFNFTPTYLIIGEKMPFKEFKAPSTYIVNKYGEIVVKREGIANWNSKEVRKLLDELVNE